MATKYIKKQVPVEAFQMNATNIKDDTDWPVWMKEAKRRKKYSVSSIYKSNVSDNEWVVNNASAAYNITEHDYVIYHPNGEITTMNKLEFTKTYERYI